MSEFERVPTYGIIQLAFATWDEVYVYGDGELVDTIEDGDGGEGLAWPAIAEYRSSAKSSHLYDLDESFDDDVLPDEFREIPQRVLRERVEG